MIPVSRLSHRAADAEECCCCAPHPADEGECDAAREGCCKHCRNGQQQPEQLLDGDSGSDDDSDQQDDDSSIDSMPDWEEFIATISHAVVRNFKRRVKSARRARARALARIRRERRVRAAGSQAINFGLRDSTTMPIPSAVEMLCLEYNASFQVNFFKNLAHTGGSE